jgi:hypothetical protein
MLNILNQIRKAVASVGIVIIAASNYLPESWNAFKVFVLTIVFVACILSISTKPEGAK